MLYEVATAVEKVWIWKSCMLCTDWHAPTTFLVAAQSLPMLLMHFLFHVAVAAGSLPTLLLYDNAATTILVNIVADGSPMIPE